MKTFLFVINFILLIFNMNSENLRYLQPQPTNSNSNSNTYDYSNYASISSNENKDGAEIKSTVSDESVIYITSSKFTISDSNIEKESGDSSSIENSELYGVNAAVLVQGGQLDINGGNIKTSAKGANAICVTNNGFSKIGGTTITSTGESSRGLQASYKGRIYAENAQISSNGNSSPTLASGRGMGIVSTDGCTLSTEGSGSPLIYSAGGIQVSGTSGTSTGSQAVVIEGEGSAVVRASSYLKCYGIGNKDNVDKCGVMLYQSIYGDADSVTSIFSCERSTLEIVQESTVYDQAPMFFITNTDALIDLTGCTFNYGSNIFLYSAGTTEWGIVLNELNLKVIF